VKALHPELREIVSDLDLSQESRGLLLEILVEAGKTIAPNDALRLLWLLGRLKAGGITAAILIQKTHLLENFLNLIRQDHKKWVSRVCYILYEGTLSRQHFSSIFPQGMIRDLLRWVNLEKADKARGILWSVLLRKEVGLATVAKIADVTTGLCEKDPITRNNVIRFLFEHFPSGEVVDSLFQYSMASGRRIPGVVFKRYAGLLKEQEHPEQKKFLLEKILSTATLDDKDIEEIFSDYMNTLNRFDLIRLLSPSGDTPPRISILSRKRRQVGFEFQCSTGNSPDRALFRERARQCMEM
jgi:hypothetical protein